VNWVTAIRRVMPYDRVAGVISLCQLFLPKDLPRRFPQVPGPSLTDTRRFERAKENLRELQTLAAENWAAALRTLRLERPSLMASCRGRAMLLQPPH
jgi:hypothetical protein